MDTMGFADALSQAGVRYLAASPETMLAPGVPSDVAHAIASHESDPHAMAKAVVSDVMRTTYDAGDFGGFGPAAAFDVLDLDPKKISTAEAAIKRLNDDVAIDARESSVRSAVRADAGAIDGMVRFPEGSKDLPWHADRPAIAFYDTLASDGRLDPSVCATMRASPATRCAISCSPIARAGRSGRSAAPTTPTRSGRRSIFRRRAVKSIRGLPAA